MSEKKEKITIDYSEPVEYFPKEIREKYFGEVERKKGKKKGKKEKTIKIEGSIKPIKIEIKDDDDFEKKFGQ